MQSILPGASQATRSLPNAGASTLLNGLAGYWKLDETGGTRADSSGAGNTLTDNNTTLSAAGKVGNAASFVALSLQSLSIANNATLQMGDIDFTISVWVWLDSKTIDRTLISKGTSSASVGAEFWMDYKQVTDRFRFVIGDAAGVAYTLADSSALGSPALSTWYHVIGWHDSAADTVNLQINGGTPTSTATSGRVVPSTTGALRLGSLMGALYMDGRLDEAGIYKRVLTASERAALYNGGSGNTYSFVGT